MGGISNPKNTCKGGSKKINISTTQDTHNINAGDVPNENNSVKKLLDSDNPAMINIFIHKTSAENDNTLTSPALWPCA